MRVLRLALLLAASGSASASTLEDGQRCLAANDVPCALEVVESLDATSSGDAETLAFAGKALFYAQQFERAAEVISRARDAGWVDRYEEVPLYQRTRDVHGDFTEARRGDLVVRYRPGVDVVLVEDAFDVLKRSVDNLTPLLGGPTPGDVKVELYPDGASFIASSSLPARAVKTTGVVALSKWSRLLVTSPRALGRGYGWQDTVAHEYIHLVVSYHTHDRAPVWLQEGIAKYLDARWRDGRDAFHLDPRAQALLAVAIAEDGLVSFDEMHPSLALLPTPERAALAYAQLATMVAFSFEKGGEMVLTRVLPRVDAGEDPRDALAAESGYATFEAFWDDWVSYVRTLGLIERKISELPTMLDSGNAMDTDPLLAKRADLQRYVRLGDLLRQRDRHEAALVEYRKALQPSEPPSPILSNGMALSLLALDRAREAEEALEASMRDYPEFAVTHATLGQIREAQGRVEDAIAAYRQAVALHPFDQRVQGRLAALYEQLGNTQLAARYARNLRMLRRGGEEPSSPVRQ